MRVQIGIDPPRGVLLYGSPGTGKTMLAKAVAHHTTAAFIRVVGSEFVQKYLGEGPRMVRDVFRLAKENSPAIIFIDEVDAIATARFDAQTGADREVQRILMELLNQMDGFDQTVNVKARLRPWHTGATAAHGFVAAVPPRLSARVASVLCCHATAPLLLAGPWGACVQGNTAAASVHVTMAVNGGAAHTLAHDRPSAACR